MQWGDNLVFWVGDKTAGGKMFCLIDLAPGKRGVVSFATNRDRSAGLLETEGFFPAPYLARAGWVAAHGWSAARATEWQNIFREAHAVVEAKLPKRVRAAFEDAGSSAAKPRK